MALPPEVLEWLIKINVAAEQAGIIEKAEPYMNRRARQLKQSIEAKEVAAV